MRLTSQTGRLLVVICVGMVSAQAVQAAHATNFLDALYSEVTNRVANPGTNTAAQKAALRAASNILSRNTKRLAADVSALGTAANVLEKRFPGDATLLSLENAALAAYLAEANAQLDAAALRIGTNSIPKGLMKQLMKAEAALNKADAITNGVPARARVLKRALNRIGRPVAKVFRKYPAPPPPAFEAPMEIPSPKNLTLTENAPNPSETTIFYFHTVDNMGARYLHYSSHNPEELGTWTYTKTTSTTAVIHCNVDFAQEGGSTAPHDFNLVFTTERTGTFTGMNTFLEPIEGTFFIDP